MCVLEPFSRVVAGTRIGDHCRLGQGCVVGGAPQDLSWRGGRHPCRLGHGVRVGEYATIHGGAKGETVLEDEVFVMAYAHVGHDGKLGRRSILANGVQLGGHVHLGTGANIGGGTLVQQHVRIGEFSFVAGGLRIERDVLPWSKIMGPPACWAGLNAIALRRAGWDAVRIRTAEEILRQVVRRGLGLSEARALLGRDESTEARVMVEFLEGALHGIIRPVA